LNLHKIGLWVFLVTTLTITNSGVLAKESTSTNNDVFYVAKFVCGSIFSDEGPLRPGHYDTSISILNKHHNSTTFFWNVSMNNSPESHATLLTLDTFQSTGINCQDIKRVSGVQDRTELVEGFVLVTVPQTYNVAEPSTITTSSNNQHLEVQVFYTANALDSLPHEVVYEKISFYIIQDGTKKIPKDMIRTTLDVTLQSELNKISNTEMKVKNLLSESFNIDDEQLEDIEIRIKDVSIGVGSMIDDHAISLSILKPQGSLEYEEIKK